MALTKYDIDGLHYWAPQKKGLGWVCFKGSDSPPAPDYEAQAKATAQGNLDAARVNAKANRVSEYTPYGNLIYQNGGGMNRVAYDQANKSYQDQLAKWNAAGGDNQQKEITQGTYTQNTDAMAPGYNAPASQIVPNPNFIAKPVAPNENDFMNGDPDKWSATVQLAPDQQRLLEMQNKTSLGLGSLMDQGVGYVQNMLNKPFDRDNLPKNMVGADQTGQEAIMARLQPTIDMQNKVFDQTMANQGIAPGTEAYENAKRSLSQQHNDQYMQAALQGIGIGNQARQQGIQEQSFFRNEPLNTLNAVRSGAQVTTPSFFSTPQQAMTQGPDYMGAANSQYNAALGQSNADAASSAQTQQGIIGIASVAAMAF